MEERNDPPAVRPRPCAFPSRPLALANGAGTPRVQTTRVLSISAHGSDGTNAVTIWSSGTGFIGDRDIRFEKRALERLGLGGSVLILGWVHAPVATKRRDARSQSRGNGFAAVQKVFFY